MRRLSKRVWGLSMFSFGLGIVLALLVPLWGWRFTVGCIFVCIGWWFFTKC